MQRKQELLRAIKSKFLYLSGGIGDVVVRFRLVDKDGNERGIMIIQIFQKLNGLHLMKAATPFTSM